MKTKNLRRSLIISGFYVLLISVLIIGITMARYEDAKVAYTSFGAANFNALLLGENTVAAMTDSTNPVVNEFGVNLNETGLHPGMTWNANAEENTSVQFPFSVTNGTKTGDCSQVSVEYSLRLRTLESLPLKYTLSYWVADTSETNGGHYTYYTAGDPTTVTNDDADAGTWYEYRFYQKGTENESSENEAVFELTGGSLQLNAHQLVVEWPVVSGGENGKDTNSSDYMKEIEMAEIQAVVSSKNMLSDDYLKTAIPDQGTVYSTGLIILNPADGTSGTSNYQYSYDIDFRSFSPDANASRSFTFNVENGVGKGRTQTSMYSIYNMQLKIPVNEYTKAYQYTLYQGSTDEGTLLGTPTEYRLYNELDGTYTVCPTADYPSGKQEPDYKMYAIYSITANSLLQNKTNNGDGQDDYFDSDTYTLSISKTDASSISSSEIEEMCFDNKLQILVDARFTDTPN
jgi:hypothetical protein